MQAALSGQHLCVRADPSQRIFSPERAPKQGSRRRQLRLQLCLDGRQYKCNLLPCWHRSHSLEASRQGFRDEGKTLLDLQISNSSQLDRSSMFLGHHKMAIAAYSIPNAGVLPTSAACMCWRVPHNVILTCYVGVL